MEPRNDVTVIIHGTYAVGEGKDYWWRRAATGDAPTFGDRLESELTARGVSGSVWRGLADAGDYEMFEWSGKNKHRHRMKAAKQLAQGLGVLADRGGHGPDDPLVVNLVAHSHGGNVALESLRHLPENVHIGSCTMLGTPLIHRRPGARLLALYMAFLITLLFWFVLIDIVYPQDIFVDEFGNPDPLVVRLLLALVLFSVYPWFAHWIMSAVEPVYRYVIGAFRRPRWHGWRGERVYGPSAEDLEDKGVGPIRLLTSHGDEADLILNVGAAPRLAYKDLIQDKWTAWWQRPIELLYLRPWFYSIALPVLQALLEHYALGFGWWKVLVNDYELIEEDPAIEVLPVTAAAMRTLRRELASRQVLLDDHDHGGDEHRYGEELVSMLKSINAQIKLRHSMYYESDDICRFVANSVTNDEPIVRESAPDSPPVRV